MTVTSGESLIRIGEGRVVEAMLKLNYQSSVVMKERSTSVRV